MEQYTPPEISSILGLVDTFMRWRGMQSFGTRKYQRYHPSEWGKCLRRQQYKHYIQKGIIKCEEVPLGGDQARLFDVGHAAHQRWQESYFGMMGILRGRWKCENPYCYAFDNEGKPRFEKLKEEHFDHMKKGKTRVFGMDDKLGAFKPEKCLCGCVNFKYCELPVIDESMNMEGHCDIVLDFSNFDAKKFDGVRHTFNIDLFPKKPIVVDMKTCGDWSWKNQVMKLGPHKAYIAQITMYAHLLDCEYGIIYYENKNDSKTAAYKVERNDDFFNTMKRQARLMIAMSEKNLLPPPKPRDKSDYECSNCELAGLCHKSKAWDDPNLEEKRKAFYGCLL